MTSVRSVLSASGRKGEKDSATDTTDRLLLFLRAGPVQSNYPDTWTEETTRHVVNRTGKDGKDECVHSLFENFIHIRSSSSTNSSALRHPLAQGRLKPAKT